MERACIVRAGFASGCGWWMHSWVVLRAVPHRAEQYSTGQFPLRYSTVHASARPRRIRDTTPENHTQLHHHHHHQFYHTIQLLRADLTRRGLALQMLQDHAILNNHPSPAVSSHEPARDTCPHLVGILDTRYTQTTSALSLTTRSTFAARGIRRSCAGRLRNPIQPVASLPILSR